MCVCVVADDRNEVFSINHVLSLKPTDEQSATLTLESGNYVRFQVDNVASVNAMPLHIYKAATGDNKLLRVEPIDTHKWPVKGTVIVHV